MGIFHILGRYRKSGFTLAEMMVILTVMSVVMAATMPVLTARQGVGESSALGGSGAGVKWQRNKEFIATAYPHSFIAIGMEPDSSDLGALNHAAVMYVKNREGNITSSSQIGLLKQMTVQKDSVYSNNYYSAGRIAMDRYNNIALGSNTMYNGSIGLGNISIGTYSMYNSSNNTDYNIAIGRSSLQHQTGNTKRNIAIGYNSLYEVKDTNDTIYIGSGTVNTSSSKSTSDVYIGRTVGLNQANTRSTDETKNNVVIGTDAHLSNNSDNVVSIGTNSGSFGMTDSDNGISIGANSGAGFGDVSIGNTAKRMNGSTNKADKRKDVRIGIFSGYYANADFTFSENDSSVYLGTYAGMNSSTKQGVVHVGYKAGHQSSVNKTSYASLVAIGYNAGAENMYADTSNNVDLGSFAGYQQAYTTVGNINIGTNAARSSSKLSNCICIGHGACMSYKNLQNSLFLGSRPTGSAIIKGNNNDDGTAGSRSAIAPNGGLANISRDYDMHLDDNPNRLKKIWDPQGELGEKYSQLIISPNGTAYAGTSSIIMFSDIVYGPTQTFTMYSDKRLKENIKKSEVSLNDFRKINTYQFNYKNDKTIMAGTIAQEMQQIFPKSVVEKNGYLSVDAEWIIFPMINAIKELDLKLSNINKKLNNYITNYKKLYDRAIALDNEVKILESENKRLRVQVNNLYIKTKIKESVNK